MCRLVREVIAGDFSVTVCFCGRGGGRLVCEVTRRGLHLALCAAVRVSAGTWGDSKEPPSGFVCCCGGGGGGGVWV